MPAMAQRVPMPCPNCGSALRIRVQNLGRRGKCNHCGHLFRPQVRDVADLARLLVPGPALDPGVQGGGREARGSVSSRTIEKIRGLFAAAKADEQATRTRRL